MATVDRSDEDIARAVQNGDGYAFGALMERYEPKMLRYARRFLLNTEDAQDFVQDVFLKAYINIKSFDPARRFSPWIYRIAHNTFVNAIRARSREKVYPIDLDVLFPHPAAKEMADDDLKRKEIRSLLDRTLSKLDPKYREPLVLYYFEDLSYRDIADVLEIPVATVGVRLQRGKARLRDLVQAIDQHPL